MNQKVTVLKTQDNVVLVEYLLGAQLLRVYIPVAALQTQAEGTYCALTVLEQGIPFGELWELLPLGNVGAEAVAYELRRRGIWTTSDLLANLNQARAALQSAYQRDFQTLLDVLRSAQSEG